MMGMKGLAEKVMALFRPPVSVGRVPLKMPPVSMGPDRLICGSVLGLTALGVVMVFSAGAAFAASRYGDWTFFLKRDALYATLGIAAFIFGMRTDYGLYRRITYPLLLISVVMLVAVLVVGTRVGGAVRWFRFGPLSFQPSEVAKFALTLYLAVLLARKAEKVREFSVGFLPPLLITGMMMALLLKQPDLGDAVIIGVVALLMLFVAGTRTSYIIVSVLVAAPVGWKVFITGEPWRVQRMLAFLDPYAFRRKAGYQLYESLISVGSGGFFGRGLGAGRQKLFFLPEAHTDFILSIIGEELGLVGVLAVLGAFVVLVWRGYRAALRARDVFGSYLAFGLASFFGLEALMNMGVVLGALPTKGLPLPFISYGGTSLIVNLFMAGVLANISACQPELRTANFLGAFSRRAVPGRNRRTEPGARILVETARTRRKARLGPPPFAPPQPPRPDDSVPSPEV